MAFTYDISTNRGKVRLGLADTREAHATFSDAEIDHFLTTGGTVTLAVAEGLKVLMVAAATRGDAAEVGRIQALLDRMSTDGSQMPTVSVTYPAALPMDDGFDPLDP